MAVMMRWPSRRSRWQIVRHGLLAVLCLCACSDIGQGVPGAGTPLPAGGLPAAQTLEGGAQIRLSPAGFAKLASIVPALLNDALGQGVCVPEFAFGATDVCYLNDGSCTQGCFIDVDLSDVHLSVTNQNTLDVAIQASAGGAIRIDPPIVTTCTASLTADLSANADITVSIDPTTGALEVRLDRINDFDTNGVNFSGCAIASDLALIMTEVIDSLLTAWVVDGLTPALHDAIDTFAPAPAEFAAIVDLPALALTGLASSSGSAVETRVAPGGYATLVNNGLSLGVVTGFNADADPQTRSGALASEPASCVADLAAPDFALPPFSLATTARDTFALPGAGEFLGLPEPADDLLVGASEAALDLAGHHMIAAGGLCLDIGTERAAFVRRDVLDDLLGLPLAASDEELRLLVRPQQPIRFDVGAGTAESPYLHAQLDDLAIDVEALPGGAPTPVLRLTADVGIDWQVATRSGDGLPTRLESLRSALTVSNPSVEVFDARYDGLNAADLDGLAGTVADVVFSTLGADAGTVLASTFAGFELANVRVAQVATASDEFLAIRASLGANPPNPPAGGAPAPTPQPTSVDVMLPTPAALRAALLAGNDAGLPTVHVALPTSDGGRPLEYAWRTAGSPWRPYQATGDLAIRDRSFAWQGERTIELRSRVVGDDGTTSPTAPLDVAIDYAPPALFVDQLIFADSLVVPARDALSSSLEWALGPADQSEPTTAFASDPNLDAAAALAFGGDVAVYVRDDAGHVTRAALHLLANDVCSAAAPLDAAQSLDASFATSAASDPVASCGAGDRSVWFSYLPEASGDAQIATSGSGYPTLISVWQAAPGCGALATEVACGANAASVPVQQGVPLLIQVQRSAPGETGDLEIEIIPEPGAVAGFALACAALAVVARARR